MSILGQTELVERPDLDMYPPLDPNIPICDQLEITSQGTSGYKEGESFFDEDYYEEF